ncbi:Fic family protein [Pseudactinotalea suaedae]|uniref:Fic family protein n=1 Tax=Pseudactinotalea suaedae TaxID=1524924 RepID=UPI00240D1447|nr:Fic family protein [Pseudactinotalea suaedae]
MGAGYVPPPVDAIPDLIDDLITFAARSALAPFVQVAIAHAQFETIQTFSDGDGRVGRALAQSMLRHIGITRSVAARAYAGPLADVDDYHQTLMTYRSCDIEPIVSSFAHAASRQSPAHGSLHRSSTRSSCWFARLTAQQRVALARRRGISDRRHGSDSGREARRQCQPNVYLPLRQMEEGAIVQPRRKIGVGETLRRADDVLEALDCSPRAG